MTLKQVIAEMAASYSDIHVMARQAIVSPTEVQEAFKNAKPDTVEHVILGLLKHYNPVIEPVKPAE